MTDESNPTNIQPSQSASILANRYQVIRVLGKGGDGTTYLATDTQMPSRRTCVVKQLKPLESIPQMGQLVQERFQREAAILENLGNGNSQIPDLYAYFEQEGQYYLVEEWITGQTLAEVVTAGGAIPESDVRSLLVKVLDILIYVHDHQMVHRDIKPNNIVLREADGQPVLLDFGSVKEAMGTALDSQGDHSIVVGTPGFMSPEQSTGRPVFSSDLYSLGMTAIFMLTGRWPQDLEPDRLTGKILWQAHAPQVSPALAEVIDRATQMQPQARFMSAQEMQQALSPSSKAWKSTVVSHPPPTPEVPIPAVPSVPPPAIPIPKSPIPAVSSAPPFVPPPITPLVDVVPQAVSTPLATSQSVSAAKPQSSNDWLKAIIIGGLIGLSILGGTLILRAHLLSREKLANETSERSDTTTARSQMPSSADRAPVITDQTPAIDVSGVIPNATIAGDPGRKNIRSGPGTSYAVLGNIYPGDRIQVIGNEQESNGFNWYEVIAPSVRTRGWVAHHLVTFDNAPVRSAPPRTSSSANATVVGGGIKNIRSGPGTVNRVVGQISTGDRVRIIAQAQDSGGYTWYRVSAGGQQGWIAAQLLNPD